MENVAADFTINNNNLEAEFDLGEEQHFDCSFELFASGTVWGSIGGLLSNQTDLQNALDGKQNVLTAGDNIQIVDGVISATDTTYTAGTGISIVNGVISNTQTSAQWGNITGTLSNQTDLQNALNAKQDTISDLSSIRSNAQNGASAYNTIQTYGDIVTYNAADFATSAQGTLASTALQPGDNISELVNNSGYITGINSSDVTAALGYTPYDSNNPDGFISGIDSTDVTTALGYTPYDSSNPAGYITSAALPTNYVTTNTAQTISSSKAFSQPIIMADNNGLASGTILSNKKILQRTTDNTLTLNNIDNKLRLIGSETRPKYSTDGTNWTDLALSTDVATYSAGTGIDITSNTVSVTSPTVIDNATGTHSIAIGDSSQSTVEGSVAVGDGSKANSTYSTAVGYNAQATNTNSVAIGKQAKATAARTVAIGSGAEANANDAYVIKGINNTANTFQVGSYTMLDTSTGLIPDGRISSNIARITDIPTVGDGTITFTQGGVTKGTITTNQSGDTTIALDAGGSGGIQNTATGTDSLTILGNATSNDNATNIGINSTASNDYAIAFGNGTTASGENSVAIGNANEATGDNSIAIGTLGTDYVYANGNYSTAIGVCAAANGDGDVVIGYEVSASDSGTTNNILIGNNNYVTGATNSLALYGNVDNASATSVTSSIAIGGSVEGASAGTLQNAIQLGSGTNSTSDSLQVGSYQLLDTSTGLIPDARISSNIARTSDLSGYQTTSNLVTSISNTSTDTQYPSAKCVYDEIQAVKRNIGEIVQSTIPLTDAGLHLLDGSLLTYGSYQAFIDYIADLYDSGNYAAIFDTEVNWQSSVTTYGVCGKFVYDSVNQTVRLPKITGFTEGTIDPTVLGDLVQAGLPNISGSVNFNREFEITNATGAMGVTSYTSASYYYQWQTTNYGGKQLSFNASNSNAIYGNSSTVQPQAIKVLYYIVIANATKTTIQVDIDEIATDLNGKADVDLTNVNDAGTSLAAGWPMPSSTYDDLTLGSSGSSYTAPTNGWFSICKVSSATGQSLGFENSTKKIGVASYSSATNQYIKCFLPAHKGDVVYCYYATGGTTNWFRFIYAVGSESEVS